MPISTEPLWDRTLRRIREIWPLGDPELKDIMGPSFPESDFGKVRAKIDACLDSLGGEVSARARAAELGEAYSVLNAEGRRRFLELLAREYDVDDEAVEAAITKHRQAVETDEKQTATSQLRDLLEPPRSRLMRQFNGLREGVKFLVDLRAELIEWARESRELKALDNDVYRLLESWFDVGFLDLQLITWKSPADLLEKLVKYQAVHRVRSWQDLKNRLEEDRRCYAFFHPRMPDEPLIFVEVALVNGISTNVHELLDEKAPATNPKEADTAIFYSISNCQKGLAGVGFGNFLIKRVVADLKMNLPNLKTFSTLSPIPGFVGWVKTLQEESDLFHREHEAINLLQTDDFDAELFRATAVPEDRSGKEEKERARKIEQSLLHLCACYLLEEKRGLQAFDRVAHFHLKNGAQIRQINWAADLTDNGIMQSAGMMVNYLYDLSHIEKNHEAYSSHGEVAAMAPVRKLHK